MCDIAGVVDSKGGTPDPGVVEFVTHAIRGFKA